MGKFKIYLSIENHPQKLVHLYESLQKYRYEHRFAFKEMQINGKNEEILFHYFLEKNLHIILLTIALYFLCLIFFVKNLFFILAILVHLVLTCGISLLIYSYIFHLPWTMLNSTSLILYFFIVLIDSFLWYACWFINNHRRDDCPIQRIVENLITQAFFYLMPKNLTAIIALVITYMNQIIALQCFTVFSFLLITISFVISFTLYPGKRDNSVSLFRAMASNIRGSKRPSLSRVLFTRPIYSTSTSRMLNNLFRWNIDERDSLVR